MSIALISYLLLVVHIIDTVIVLLLLGEPLICLSFESRQISSHALEQADCQID